MALSSANKNRCPVCNKKLPILPLTCKCGINYCEVHRSPEIHNCKYDYRNEFKKTLDSSMGDAAVADKLNSRL
jgi:hypothetical protein